jgi:hypothetical protein
MLSRSREKRTRSGKGCASPWPIFRAREDNKRMKYQAARICRVLCRTRVAAEIHQRRGTRLADHLKLVLSIIDRQGH